MDTINTTINTVAIGMGMGTGTGTGTGMGTGMGMKMGKNCKNQSYFFFQLRPVTTPSAVTLQS